MKQLFSFILLCCSLSCTSPNKIPDDVMGINEMKPLMWDMMRAGALTQNMYARDTANFKKETFAGYEQVFKIYNITKDQFYTSYKYYLEHPDKHKILMDSIVSYSNRKRGDLFKSKQ